MKLTLCILSILISSPAFSNWFKSFEDYTGPELVREIQNKHEIDAVQCKSKGKVDSVLAHDGEYSITAKYHYKKVNNELILSGSRVSLNNTVVCRFDYKNDKFVSLSNKNLCKMEAENLEILNECCSRSGEECVMPLIGF